MNLIKLDSSDVEALDHISKTHPPNRFVYPAFGVSHIRRKSRYTRILIAAGQPWLP